MKNAYIIVFTILFILFFSCEKQYEKNNWKRCNYTTDTYLETLFFLNEKYGFVGGGDPGEPSSSLLIKTTDGGETWKYIDFISEKPIKKISFISENTGYVSTRESLYKTIDGGLNWSKIDLGEELESVTIHDFSFAGDDHGYVIVSKDIEWISHYKFISTEDGGLNWQIKLQSSLTYRLPDLTSVQTLRTSGDVVYINSSNSLYKSKDGGNTWTKIFYTESGGSVWNFYFLDEQNGCIANHLDNLYVTAENGEAFMGIVENFDLDGATKPIMINKNEGFLAVYKMYYFNVDKKEITSLAIPDDYGIQDFVMLSATTGYALSNSKIYKYNGN